MTQQVTISPASGEQSGIGRPATPKLKASLVGPTRVGLIGAFALVVVGGGWAATAELAGAAVAPGVVNPESVRYTIQHLEGGIIKSIDVKEGQTVKVGDPLVMLDDVAARASRIGLSTQLFALKAQERRLTAERTGAPEVVFEETSETVDRPAILDVIRQELNRFDTRRRTIEISKSIFRQRIEQATAQRAGYTKLLEGNLQQQDLIKQELTVVEDMHKRGLERLPRLLALKRALVDSMAKEGEMRENIQKATEAISETGQEIKRVDAKMFEDVDAELAQVSSKRIQAEEELRKLDERLNRLLITSPVNGTVLSIKFRTERGVVRPGEAIMEIVPTNQEFIISARVSPKDISEVHAGLEAWVVFPNYSRRTTRRIIGYVRQVSADSIQDQPGSEKYYLAKVEVPRENLEKAAANVEMTPGMPAEVFITTGERTVLQYLIQPLTMRLNRGLREH